MGLLDRLFGQRRTSGEGAGPVTGEDAVARWRYLVRTAPPEAVVAAHASGVEALEADLRAEVLQRIRSALGALEPGAVVPADAAVLVRAGARAERRVPGFLERALSAGPQGGRALTGLATAVVATAAAGPFLRGFEASLAKEALAGRRVPDFDDGAPDPSGGAHGDDLDDED